MIWLWPTECADRIIKYLKDKYDNTIQGKIAKAAKKEGYMDTRPQLYKQEKELLGHLDLTMDNEIVRDRLFQFFHTRSHRELTHQQHWMWVQHLKKIIDDMEQL